MSEHLAAASAAVGGPEGLVMRSARARAQAAGTTAEAVLAGWAGSEAGPVPAPAPVPVAAASATPAAETPPGPGVAEAPQSLPEPVEEAAPAAAAAASVPEVPEPARWEPEEEAEAAGAIPRWLAALFVLIPALALLYVLFLPNGPNCGDAGRLAVDPVTGVAVNCDLTPYGSEITDFFAIGLRQYAACASCHGDNGGGAGTFPGFGGGELLRTFPEGSCQEQVDWVALGTAGWPEPTYGATAKPVGGSGVLMPAFGGILTDEQLRAVVLYERVQFGGQALAEALVDCGLAGDAP